MPKVFAKSYGCQMNVHDTDRTLELMQQQGYESTTTMADADVIVLMTCSIREKAEEKVFDELGRIRKLKHSKPELKVTVGGCVASQEGEAIFKRSPWVDVVFGPQTLHRLPQLLQQRSMTGHSQIDISFPEIEKFDALPTPKVEAGSAFLVIAEGCSKYCSFCVVPYTRGEEVSRRFEDIMKEASALLDQGVRDITLLGQNVNAWRGQDHGDDIDFSYLLHSLAQLPQLKRLRYLTSHPKDMSSSLVEAHGHIDVLADYLHLPVQSGSDRILAAMKRGYTSLEYKHWIRQLQQANPHISIGTDLIVGFPGETEADFQKTLDLVDAIGFDTSYSFIYSPRPGTPAALLSDDTSASEKADRLSRLQEKLEHTQRRHLERELGRELEVVVAGRSRRQADVWFARTSHHHTINFTGIASGSEATALGQWVKLKVTDVAEHSLRGCLVSANHQAADSAPA